MHWYAQNRSIKIECDQRLIVESRSGNEHTNSLH